MTVDLSAPVDAADHIRGVGGGRQLVVYGDFECPFTASAMRDIGRMLDGGAAFEVVYRHFPLRTIHPHAQEAAKAAEAAARQDRFWEMHDLLFRNQRHLESEELRRFAERLELDLGRFDSHIADRDIRARVARDVQSGLESGVDGTPRLFIDGARYEGPRDADSLAAALGVIGG
jgi:protein-disulfide isomerase